MKEQCVLVREDDRPLISNIYCLKYISLKQKKMHSRLKIITGYQVYTAIKKSVRFRWADLYDTIRQESLTWTRKVSIQLYLAHVARN